MSVVQILQPPDFASASFELCYAEGLGLIVWCRNCEVAVLLWNDTWRVWIDENERVVKKWCCSCWASCGQFVKVPSDLVVRNFEAKAEDELLENRRALKELL